MNVRSCKIVWRKYFTERLAGWRRLMRCGSKDHGILVSHGDYSGDYQFRFKHCYKDVHIEKQSESIAAAVDRVQWTSSKLVLSLCHRYHTQPSQFSVTGVATRQPRAQFWFDAGKQHWGPVLDVSMGLPHPRQQDCAFKIHVDWDIKEHTDPNRLCTCRCVVGSQKESLRSESQMCRPGDVGYFSHRGTSLRAYQGI